ncbi:hypothetical protein RKD33_006801 [Streptomyces sp. SAI-129]
MRGPSTASPVAKYLGAIRAPDRVASRSSAMW